LKTQFNDNCRHAEQTTRVVKRKMAAAQKKSAEDGSAIEPAKESILVRLAVTALGQTLDLPCYNLLNSRNDQ